MKKTKLFILLLFSSLFITYSQSVATYDITFTSVWNSSDHGTLPDDAHWSKLVGSNHNNDVTFLEMGQLATQGIEDIAELGDNNIFMDFEVLQAINSGKAEQYINGNSLASAAGNININSLEVSEDFPLLTLVSMIAPSPDWMIAVNSVNLRDGNFWKNRVSIDLYPYDAGTDDGLTYNAANANSNPQEVITSLIEVGPFNDQKIGTLTITLQSVLSIEEFNSDLVKLYPNPLTTNLYISAPDDNLVTETTIYDVLGKEVLNSENGTNKNLQTINVANLNRGFYIVKLKFVKGESILKKIVIN
jgi:hypothetical protein